MTGKIFRSIMIAAGGVLLACTIIIMGCLYDYFGSVQKQQLWDELSLAAVGVETSGGAYLDALSDSRARLTWIGTDGAVLYDAQADEKGMENHAEREEVREALNSGEGDSTRYSSTLLEKTVYCARRLSDGTVLRISVSSASMGTIAFGMLQPICVVLFLVLCLAFWLARRLSKRIVEPLNRLDLDHPMENQTYDEIAPLLRRIGQQRKQIDAQLRQLQQKKDEFEQVTASMNEGLVLLNDQGLILSINAAAKRLFHVQEQTIGQDFLTIERSREIHDAMMKATRDGHSEVLMERNGRAYQIDMSRILSEGTALGVVLLIFDVTEKIDAERTRREFTANVSHELKTPLTAILGSSELLQSGVVKPEDVPRFVGHIRQEAARLLSLIEDIIRLSQLDEGMELQFETADLSVLTQDAVQELQEKAERAQVQLHLQTDACVRQTVPRLVHEIVFNLVENAIKYNAAGGSVNVTFRAEGVLEVEDTGIGISVEHQERVFERFYRVDKSHSRQTGGTGLGLSIVKHACSTLGAVIQLQSEVGKGTVITVIFPE